MPLHYLCHADYTLDSSRPLLKMTKKILITGCLGQIGTELTLRLSSEYGAENVLATDIRPAGEGITSYARFETLDVKNAEAVEKIIDENGITDVYHLAAMLSATAEKHPLPAWDLNMNSLLGILELARRGKIKQIFWPSSIGVFGPHTQLDGTPQYTVTDPDTVYGISKLTGELWCAYYHEKYGVDVRSVRFPGLISWKAEPGGGTTDYAVDIFHKAVTEGRYECFLSANTSLPMLYMPDALDAIVNIMKAPSEKIKVRTSYNLAGVHFTPQELACTIKKRIPSFEITYKPDFRQTIADTWPNYMDESYARRDWGWNFKYGIDEMADDMIENLRKKYGKS